ncbi:MAG: CcmD family protein [Desulfovibrio sp.]|nr:CcmD family protein [Desulfovibrio sp.]
MEPIIAVCTANIIVFFILGVYLISLANKVKKIQKNLEHLEQLDDRNQSL